MTQLTGMVTSALDVTFGVEGAGVMVQAVGFWGYECADDTFGVEGGGKMVWGVGLRVEG